VRRELVKHESKNLYGMDFLVTWNFHHINNARMKKEITKISEKNGYECPIICSPEEIEGA